MKIKGLALLVLAPCLLAGCGDQDASVRVRYTASGDYLRVWDGTSHRPLFIKGINLGVGLPGKQPGELAVTREQYARWFKSMGAAGFNTIRIYTLHYPRFYEELKKYNETSGNRTLYLMQGIWLDEDNPRNDLYNLTTGFRTEIEQLIDCVHGNCSIPTRRGKAFGSYTADVSKWTIGWLIARELIHSEVLSTDMQHPNNTAFKGNALQITNGTASEVWATSQLDHTITYERYNYGVERPVSFTSWPTLDPIRHPTENHKTSDEDNAQIDVTKIALANAPAGIFASFHAYPYYPNFISEDPNYRKYKDSYGPNSYLGYLVDLRRYHSKMPLVVAEVGVPSSWGNAHFSHSGMHHGGHDEAQKGLHDGRLLQNVYNTNCAGAIMFSWFDEWWKRTWITDYLDSPREKYRLWPNFTAAEQNFGYLTFELGNPDFSKWGQTKGTGRVQSIQAASDGGYFHLQIKMVPGLSPGETATIGFDTYRDDLGESVLPDKVKTKIRSELALTIKAPDSAQLLVTEAYDLTGIWHKIASDKQKFHSTATDGAPWIPVRWQNDDEHQSDDKTYYFPASYHEIGKLRVTTGAMRDSSKNAVEISSDWLRVRIPWTLLQVNDPTALAVMHDDRSTPALETTTTNGIAVAVSIKGLLLETGRFKWEGWSEPPKTVEREKPALKIFSSAMDSLSDHPNVN